MYNNGESRKGTGSVRVRPIL